MRTLRGLVTALAAVDRETRYTVFVNREDVVAGRDPDLAAGGCRLRVQRVVRAA